MDSTLTVTFAEPTLMTHPRSMQLSSATLIRAYASGVFPMADDRSGRIRWYAPDPRAVIPLDAFHVPRSLRQSLRKGVFEVTVDADFAAVIRACAEREETWISAEIERAYIELHRLGLAHSVETWRAGRLAGGLYGVALGGAFFGESMFSRETDASKVALVALVERLRARGFVLLDTQFLTPHLARFGAVEIPRDEYEQRLADALRLDRRFDQG